MNCETDTIAAISTALSEGGIGIIRLSGSDSLDVADRIFRNKSGSRILHQVKSHTIHYGVIVDNVSDKNGKEIVIDEVLLSVMKAPNSYTREDVVEINCHGGVHVMKKILELVLKNGARMSEPGEFTKRAFLNGRIDLSQSEAVMDMIRAKNDMALEAGASQLQGNLRRKIEEMREKILYETAFIESALDDPEHYSLDGYPEKLRKVVEDVRSDTATLIRTADRGRLEMEGIDTVIVGKPNVGKSSLLNLLCGEERAIVTRVPGTTRDALRETVDLDGITLNITDTAGIRDTSDIVENIGVRKARESVVGADLILYMADVSVPLDENDDEIISLIRGKNVIVLLNKSDLESVIGEKELSEKIEGNYSIIRTSMTENYGIDELKKKITEMFFAGDLKSNDEIVITNMRHKAALEEALDALDLVTGSIDSKMPEDFYTIDLMNAYSSLGKITGEEVGDDLVDEIFSEFCTGK